MTIDYRITLQIHGLVSEDRHIRLHDFLNQLGNLSAALKKTDRIVSKTEKGSVYYQIVDLKHSSPATVTLEARPLDPERDYRSQIIERFIGGMHQIQTGGKVPEDFDRPILESFRNLAAPVGQTISAVTIASCNYSIDLTKEFHDRIELLLAPEETYQGSINGKLEFINLHNNANVFRIYPTIGPRRVNCHFPSHLMKKAVGAINCHVSVSGLLKYRVKARFPEEVDVSEIEIFPPEEELPSLEDMRGIAPNATDDMSSEEFVRKIRDAWE